MSIQVQSIVRLAGDLIQLGGFGSLGRLARWCGNCERRALMLLQHDFPNPKRPSRVYGTGWRKERWRLPESGSGGRRQLGIRLLQ